MKKALTLTVLLAIPVAVASASAQGEVPPSILDVDQLLSQSFPSNAPGAAVLIAQNGEIRLRKGYGLANLELGTPVDPADVFHLCSVTKQFTAVAILQLVQAGKLQLDDDLGAYVPDFPTTGKKVTLAQLLGHTSGIPNAYPEEWRKTWTQEKSVTQVLDLVRGKPLDFSPGSDWKYSNAGYALLGAVIEKVSGQSYADYLQSHIFTPAGMTHSYYATDNGDPSRHV